MVKFLDVENDESDENDEKNKFNTPLHSEIPVWQISRGMASFVI